jgi:hypothetical protein
MDKIISLVGITSKKQNKKATSLKGTRLVEMGSEIHP